MKKINIAMSLVFGLFLLACNGSQNNEEKGGEPDPITEEDKSRYNLNAPEDLHYGTIDSTQDTIPVDSVVK